MLQLRGIDLGKPEVQFQVWSTAQATVVKALSREIQEEAGDSLPSWKPNKGRDALLNGLMEWSQSLILNTLKTQCRPVHLLSTS